MKLKQISREQLVKYFEAFRFVLSILIAFTISFIIIAFSAEHPLATIGNLFIGPFTSVRRFSTVLETTIPLTFAGLAVCAMFRANQFNLAAEGAFFIGALVSAIIAIYMPGPPFFVVIGGLLAGGAAGALVCAIPGALKIKWGCSEMVVSLMLNYVSLYFGTYIFNQVARDPDSAYKASFPFREGASLPSLIPKTRLHAGLFIAVACAILLYVFIYRTKWGYMLRITGNNMRFARCAGISVAAVIMGAQLIGGFIAGVGGGTEMLGMYSRFQWSSLPGYGFDGVILNILAKENPAHIPVAAFFVACLRIGADYMYRQSDVAAEIVAIIEGLVIILVAATAFMSGYRHKWTAMLSEQLGMGEANV